MDLQALGLRSYISEPDRGRRLLEGIGEGPRDAVYGKAIVRPLELSEAFLGAFPGESLVAAAHFRHGLLAARGETPRCTESGEAPA